jgi:hypothetical protein
MWRIVSRALLAVSFASVVSSPLASQQPAPASEASGPAAPQPSSSKIWVGRHAEFEEFLRTADIERITGVEVGVLGIKRAYFKPGGLAIRAAFRSIPPGTYDGFFESYKSEIAAYKLDRLLELDMVPPTVERRHDGQMVSLQLWAENMKMLKEVQEQKLRPADIEPYNVQLRRQKVFHNLVGNLDPNQGNILFDPLWNVVLVDCSRCFTNTAPLKFEMTYIDRPFFDRVKALTRDGLRRELGSYLEGGGVDAILRRRNEIVKVFEKLEKEKGSRQVFLP